MRVIVEGHPVVVTDADLLGEGGEARVYRIGAHDVLKLFHPPTSAGTPAHQQLAQRMQVLRVRKLQAFPAHLPAHVVAPRSLAHNEGGDVVGYVMARVPGGVELGRLAQRGLRAQVPVARILSIFASLAHTLTDLHARDVVVGDCNDGNVLLSLDGGDATQPFVIDADSMQMLRLPCPVAHERFLDPRLYGLDLVAAPRFTAHTDAYAWRVLLCQSLLCVHPYGGTHAAHKTLLRRAEARWSMLRDDVTRPRSALPIDLLPDELLHDFSRAFDEDVRDEIPASLVAPAMAARFRRCTCGLEHARTSCPACRTVVALPAAHVVTDGDVAVEVVRRAEAIVCATMHGGVLRFLAHDGGGSGERLVREDGSVVVQGPRPTGLVFAIAGATTWIARDEGGMGVRLVAVKAGQAIDATSTGRVFGQPAFAASSAGLFRLHGDALLHHDSGAVLGRVLAGRTWLFADDDGGCLALYRAGDVWRGLWCAPGRGPVDVELPALRGKLVSLDVHFEPRRALVRAVVDESVASSGGTRTVRRAHLVLVHLQRGVLGTLEGALDDDVHPAAALMRAQGFALAQGRVVAATREGLMLVDVNGGALVPGAAFAATAAHLDDDTRLLPATGGALCAVTPQAITRLRLVRT